MYFMVLTVKLVKSKLVLKRKKVGYSLLDGVFFDDDIGYYLVFLMIEHFLNSSKYGNITKIRFFTLFVMGVL